MSSTAIRIILADDHPIVRDGLDAVLSTQPDFTVVALASDGPEAVQLVAAHVPDVLLLDLDMPRLNGVGVIEQLSKLHPNVRIIVFTAFDTDDQIVAAIRAGRKAIC